MTAARKLATAALPGDVACLLNRLGYTDVLDNQQQAHVAQHVPQRIAEACQCSPTQGEHCIPSLRGLCPDVLYAFQ